ncbi:MAG: hypothetical protein ABWY82_12045 [Tardiphaga sp.]
MKSSVKWAAGLVLLLGVSELASTAALARGAASNIMNSPGYQRRLQESRGYVTNESGSLFSKPVPTVRYRHKARRHR